MSFSKSTRWRSEKYLAWVRKQPCACGCGRKARPHHIKGIGHFSGVGLTADDILAMPLADECHEKMQRTPELWPQQYEMICRTILVAVREGMLKC